MTLPTKLRTWTYSINNRYTGANAIADTILALKNALKTVPGASVRGSSNSVSNSAIGGGVDHWASNSDIVATAAKELKERGGGRCLVSICTAGGMGVVAILER